MPGEEEKKTKKGEEKSEYFYSIWLSTLILLSVIFDPLLRKLECKSHSEQLHTQSDCECLGKL